MVVLTTRSSDDGPDCQTGRPNRIAAGLEVKPVACLAGGVCTLTLAWQVFDDAPVTVAANRDEMVDRESLPPAVYNEQPLVVAPQDAEAGGTWIGYNEFGVFVGLTNKWTDAELAGERSRGLLVADVLEARSAADAKAIVDAATAADEYSGFYLVVADAADAFCYQWDGTLSLTAFEPGVHVVVNVAVDDDVDVPSSRAEIGHEQADDAHALRAALTAEPDETAMDWLERASDVLGDHEYGACVHENGYGTQSSSLLALGPDVEYHAFAPGPPCRTSYDEVDLAIGDGLEGLETVVESTVDDERHI